MKKISLCIIGFNVSQFVDRCLDSIIKQTILPYEIIFVDDGSSDDTYRKVEKYKKKLQQLCIKKLPQNSGEGVARNTAIKIATGDYVWAIDSDDTIPSNALEIFIDALERHDSETVIGAVEHVSQNGKHLSLFSSSKNYYNISPLDFPELSIFTSGYHVSMVIKKEILTKHNIIYGEHLSTSADGVFLFNLVQNLNHVTLIKDTVYNYFNNPGSASKRRSLQYYRDDIYAWGHLAKNIKSSRHIEYASNRFFYRISEFLYTDIQLYIKHFNKEEQQEVIKLFINSLVNNPICNKMVTISLHKQNIDYWIPTFILCLKNNDIFNATTLVQAKINEEKKVSILYFLKKFLRMIKIKK